MNALNNVVLRASIRAKREQDLGFDFDFEGGGGFKDPDRWANSKLGPQKGDESCYNPKVQ